MSGERRGNGPLRMKAKMTTMMIPTMMKTRPALFKWLLCFLSGRTSSSSDGGVWGGGEECRLGHRWISVLQLHILVKLHLFYFSCFPVLSHRPQAYFCNGGHSLTKSICSCYYGCWKCVNRCFYNGEQNCTQSFWVHVPTILMTTAFLIISHTSLPFVVFPPVVC